MARDSKRSSVFSWDLHRCRVKRHGWSPCWAKQIFGCGFSQRKEGSCRCGEYNLHIIVYVRLVTILSHFLASLSVSILYVINEKQLM